MKTTEYKSITIEKKDLQPLIDKAVAAVGGAKAVTIKCHVTGGSQGGYTETNQANPPVEVELEVIALVQKEIK
jgi:hypothetical protein